MSFHVPTLLAGCVHNAANALCKRHLLAPVNRCGHIINYLVDETKLREVFISLYHMYWNTQDLGEWKARKGQVKLASIERSHAFDREAWDRAESFVKREVVVVGKKARLIQGNANELTAYNQPVEYRAIAYALKHLFDEPVEISGVNFELRYAAGMNHDDMSDLVSSWLDQPGIKLFDERDGKNWDASMQEGTLRAEAAVYALVAPDVAACFLKRCSGVWGRIRLHGQSPSLLRYFTAWKRLSGDWNTSVGNTLISILIILNAILSLPVHLRPRTVRGLFMGDDYLGFYYFDEPVDPNALATAMNHNEMKCGITPERALFQNPMDVTFISMGLWPRHHGGYQFVPHPARQMLKLYWTTRNMQGRSHTHQATALAVAFLPTFSGFPLMEAFLRRHAIERNPKYVIDEHDYYFVTTLAQRGRGVNWRVGFNHKYELPYTACDWQLPSEKLSMPEVWYHPTHLEMLRIECLDPADRPRAVGRPK